MFLFYFLFFIFFSYFIILSLSTLSHNFFYHFVSLLFYLFIFSLFFYFTFSHCFLSTFSLFSHTSFPIFLHTSSLYFHLYNFIESRLSHPHTDTNLKTNLHFYTQMSMPIFLNQFNFETRVEYNSLPTPIR